VADCIFQIQILFSRNISLPTHSFPMLPHHSSIKMWSLFLSPWISAGSCLLWRTEYSKSNAMWVLRVGHKKTSAYTSLSCNVHCEGWQLPCEESSYPDLAMLERLRRGTPANSPSSVQLSGHSQPRHQPCERSHLKSFEPASPPAEYHS